MHPSSSMSHTTVGDSVIDVSPTDREGAEVAAETTVGESVMDVPPSERDGAEVAAETTVGEIVVDVPPEGVGTGASVIPGRPEHSLNASMHGRAHSMQLSSKLLFMLFIGGGRTNVEDGDVGGKSGGGGGVWGGGGQAKRTEEK
jgi:hypothetical protein